MSLRIFHLIFIAASALLAAGVATWGLRGYLAGEDGLHLATGAIFALLGLALVVYGVRVAGKLRRLEEKK